jgi:hypothetical protein
VSPINPSSNHAPNKAAIAGSVVGVVVLGALVGGFLFYSRRKKHQTYREQTLADRQVGPVMREDPLSEGPFDTSDFDSPTHPVPSQPRGLRVPEGEVVD